MKKYICIRECFHGHLYSKGDEKWFEDDEEVPEHFELADKEDQAKNNAPKPPEKPKADGKPKAAKANKEDKADNRGEPKEKAAADATQATPPAAAVQPEALKTAEILTK